MARTLEEVVHAQHMAYNAHDADTFVSIFAEDADVSDFVTGIVMLSGRKAMHDYYVNAFRTQPHLGSNSTMRLSVGSLIALLEETRLTPEKVVKSLIIFEVRDALVARMRTIDPEEMHPAIDSESIIRRRIDALNAGDLDALVNLHADTIELIDDRAKQTKLTGKPALHDYVQTLMAQNPGMHVEGEQRIMLGNYVIDCERVTAGALDLRLLVVYQLKNGLIQRVWYLQPD